MRITASLLVALAAVGAANAAAISSVKSNDKAIQYKRSADLQAPATDLASIAAERRAQLADTFVSLEARGQEARTFVAPLDALLGIFGQLENLKHIGVDALIKLLSKIKYDIQTQFHVVEVLLNGKFIKVVNAVRGVEKLLEALFAIKAKVCAALIHLIQKIPSCVEFIGAFVGKDIGALINGAKQGLEGLKGVAGCEKLVAYSDKYGFENVQNFLAAPGAEDLLKAAVQIPGSDQVLESFKDIPDVDAFVSGLNAIGIDSFVSAIQQVNNVPAITGAASTVATSVGI